MARFVNDVMLGETRLVASSLKARGENVVYVSRDWRHIEKYVVAQIKQLVLRDQVSFDDIFILGYSVTGIYNNIRKLENALVH